jgi:hypothetical protein
LAMKEQLQTPPRTMPTVIPTFTPVPSGLLLRKCDCGGSPGADGGCEECHKNQLALKRRSADQAEPRAMPRVGQYLGGVHAYTSLAGAIQTKLTVSRPGDQYEQEADQAAEQVIRMQRLLSPHITSPSPAQPTVQRSPNDETPSGAEGPAPEEATPTPTSLEPTSGVTTPEETPAAGLIAEDDVGELGPGQMRKSDFLAELHTAVRSTAERALVGTGRTTAGCPYLDYWFDYYSGQDSQHVERAIRKYVPEAAGATAARNYIPLISARVGRAVAVWARTGEVTGVPEGIPVSPPETGAPGGAEGSGSPNHYIAFKGRGGGPRAVDDLQTIRAQLGPGNVLDARVKSQMESAFGYDFSGVRVHADAGAAELSNRLNARAFTIGGDVAFGSGEYQPGTLVGDALIAHELAHVVQQQGGKSAAPAPVQKAQTDYNSLEEDADLSAVGAVVGLWSRAKGALAGLAGNAMPSLRSGLRLSRCSTKVERLNVCVQPVQIAEDDSTSPTTLPSFAAAQTIWGKCCINLSVNAARTVSTTAFKVLDENPSSRTGTAEEQSLFTAAGSGGSCILVFVPQTFQNGARVSKDIAGGGHTFDSGTSDAKVVAVEGVEPSVIAHELGHAMGYSFALGIRAHQPAGTVMEPSNAHNKAVPDRVASVICNQVRRFVNATPAGGNSDCTMDV